MARPSGKHWANTQYWFNEYDAVKLEVKPEERAKLAVRMLELLREKQEANIRKGKKTVGTKIAVRAEEALKHLEGSMSNVGAKSNADGGGAVGGATTSPKPSDRPNPASAALSGPAGSQRPPLAVAVPPIDANLTRDDDGLI